MENENAYIKVSNLSKKFDSKLVVDKLSFVVQKGSILGLLGANGAGKSTTMQSIVGITRPSIGVVEICGIRMDIDFLLAKRDIGFLPENPPLYLDMYLLEYLNFIALMRKISKHEIDFQIKSVIKNCGLEMVKNKKLKTLSKGYKQRVGIAQAIIHNPRILILDEPTTGLDPVQIVEIRNLIKDLAKDKAVIISTHLMQEVEEICTDILILNHGKMQVYGPIAGIKQSTRHRKIIVEFKNSIDISELTNAMGVHSIRSITEKKFLVETTESVVIREKIFLFAKRKNYVLLELTEQNRCIEDMLCDLENNPLTKSAE